MSHRFKHSARRVVGWGLVCGVTAVCTACGAAMPTNAGTRSTEPTNQAAAHLAAARPLSEVVLPAGASQTTSDPGLSGWLRGSVAGAPATLNLVDLHRFWRVSGDPISVFRWIRAHPPAGATVSGFGSSGQYGRTLAWTVTFGLPAVPGRIFEEGVGVGVSAASGGGSAVRADGWAIWLIPRPSWERVPARTRSVEVFADVIAERSFPVTVVTAPDKVGQLVSYVNSLQIEQSLARSCPSYGPGGILLGLRFLAAASSAPLARAVEDGCGGLRFWIGGRSGRALMENTDLASTLWRLGVLPVCTSQQLRASATLPARFFPSPPALVMSLNFRNVSSTVCSLDGFAGLKLRDAHGLPLPTHVAHGVNTPDAAVLTPGASATIGIQWPLPSRGCTAPRAASVDVALPRVSETISVSVGSDKHPVAPCNGRMRVEPVGLS